MWSACWVTSWRMSACLARALRAAGCAPRRGVPRGACLAAAPSGSGGMAWGWHSPVPSGHVCLRLARHSGRGCGSCGGSYSGRRYRRGKGGCGAYQLTQPGPSRSAEGWPHRSGRSPRLRLCYESASCMTVSCCPVTASPARWAGHRVRECSGVGHCGVTRGAAVLHGSCPPVRASARVDVRAPGSLLGVTCRNPSAEPAFWAVELTVLEEEGWWHGS